MIADPIKKQKDEQFIYKPVAGIQPDRKVIKINKNEEHTNLRRSLKLHYIH